MVVKDGGILLPLGGGGTVGQFASVVLAFASFVLASAGSASVAAPLVVCWHPSPSVLTFVINLLALASGVFALPLVCWPPPLVNDNTPLSNDVVFGYSPL